MDITLTLKRRRKVSSLTYATGFIFVPCLEEILEESLKFGCYNLLELVSVLD